MKLSFLFSLSENSERRCERGKKYINISVARRKPIITPNLKNVIHYQIIISITAALNCNYLSNYQLSELEKRFKEKLYLFTSQFFPNFNPQPTFSKN